MIFLEVLLSQCLANPTHNSHTSFIIISFLFLKKKKEPKRKQTCHLWASKLTCPKWRSTTEKDVKDYPCAPNVYFGAVISLQNLRSHVVRAAYYFGEDLPCVRQINTSSVTLAATPGTVSVMISIIKFLFWCQIDISIEIIVVPLYIVWCWYLFGTLF